MTELDFETEAEREERESVEAGLAILTDAGWTELLDQAARDLAEMLADAESGREREWRYDSEWF